MNIIDKALLHRQELVLAQAIMSYEKKVLTPQDALCYIAQLSELKLTHDQIERNRHEPTSTPPT